MIEIEGLSVSYRSGGVEVPALSGVSLALPPGRITGLVGESGSGKTTLVMAILGLLPPEAQVSGRILIDGVNVVGMPENDLDRFRWTRVSLVPQGSQNAFNPVLSIGAQIAEPIRVHQGLGRAEAEERVRLLLDEVGLGAEAAVRFPHELSGGQRQRAALAMALSCDPGFLLADEPTTALDVLIQAEIADLLRRAVRERKMGMALVTHDLPLASGLCETICVFDRGKLVETLPAIDLAWGAKHPRTQALVKALLEMEGGDGVP
ncbi:MAG: ABC transporter ATP-binding protein [Synergistaceae bacterium]|nr:ABC transporter ATP-binding protein [Synergistaceae bacterium]